MSSTAEGQRLVACREGRAAWKKWGPYLSGRQWATVREDYSADGDAWAYFPHDHARSRAYRWGEDGIAGVCDDQQRLCLALALWNGADAILKERYFGLTNPEGNHGEDVKELYYHLDATPTHSYLKMLYKYPQRAFPYEQLVRVNAARGKHEPEFELIDTGAFDDDRYFDVFVEYAKAGPDDLLMRITAHNRGPEEATIHIVPQLWFRNTWSWGRDRERPTLSTPRDGRILAEHPHLGRYSFAVAGEADLLFCDNETNVRRLYGMTAEGFFKDGINDCIVAGYAGAVNPQGTGTKAGAHCVRRVPAGQATQVRVRLTLAGEDADPFAKFDEILAQRSAEADAYFAELQCDLDDADARSVQRQAFAGLIWSKQSYHYDVREWLEGDTGQPAPPPERLHGRNHDWRHLNNGEILAMPDTWEYPWYAAWDLAFHCIPWALIDAEFAKHQLDLLTREWYMHPNGQLPAYEWAFDDANPPVHAWATWRVFQIDRRQRHRENPHDHGDLAFLERVFHKLLLNFTWWVNRKDVNGRNIFQGGFLGMDNIGIFDRSTDLPTGGRIDQSDGTAWMGMYCLNLMRIALELALHNRVYEDIATKFFEHFLLIAKAMTNIAETGIGLWDEEDGFFYDVLHLPDGTNRPIRLRSMVGLVPLFAVETIEPRMLERLPEFKRRLEWILSYRPELAALVSHWDEPGAGERRLLSLLRGHRMKCLLRRMLDPQAFMSAHGVRALSREYADEPYTFEGCGSRITVGYEPGDSTSNLFGGNSNWRGPVWMPMNYLIVESLQKFHHYYGDDFRIENPPGSGRYTSILEVAEALSRRLVGIFLRDDAGRRPVFGGSERFQHDPHFRDHVLFHEYFHGDNGAGLGAAHQTGWTALVAKLLQPRQPARACAEKGSPAARAQHKRAGAPAPR
ncbi:MAG TPA: glucosidase [Phycisphaerae bacterium]|nr:glucosidase [Phycisphaerae bacterium]